MRLIKNNYAVTQMISAILLLAMAVASFAVIYSNVLSDDGPNPETFATIVGKIEAEDLVFEHQSGETIDIDSKVILTIAGERQPAKTLRELLDISAQQNNWNIGERIVFHLQSFGIDADDEVKIEALITDKVSNSLIFWGMLQDGYTVPPYGRGGLWHFNESYWNGTTGEVLDSSGNGNHGTAHNGANTTNDVVSPKANRSGIFNAADDNDFVEVADHYSLDLTENITMEAWVKPFLDSPGDIDLLDQFGYTPYIARVNGSETIFVIVSEDQSQSGVIQTVNITPHKRLEDDDVIDIDYNLAEGHTPKDIRPIISHVSDDIYIVAYNNLSQSKNLSVFLKTFNISSNGSLEFTGNFIFDDIESDVGEPNRPSIVKVSNFGSYSIFAIAYCVKVDADHTSVGIIRTINISYDGKISYTNEVVNFEDVEGYGPSIIHVGGDVFAVAYRNTSNLGVIKTFNISSNGSIVYTGQEFIFDDQINTKQLNIPSFIKVSDYESYSVFAIVYGAYTDNSIPAEGIIKTIKIYHSNGTIMSTGFSRTFESSHCFNPFVIHHTENYYIIAYDTEPWADSEGKYITIMLADNGNIVGIGSAVTFDDDRCHDPVAIRISERSFGVVYESIAGGSGHPGYLKVFQIEYPSDQYSIGIHKSGSYGIYANPTRVYANINTKTINASITPNAWNYVVLTYDRGHMRLYVNGIEATTPIPFTERINITNSSLIFGDLFYGLLDEIGIYARVLSSQEIYNHFAEFAPIIISNVSSADITYNSANITWDTNINCSSLVRYGTTIPPTEDTISVASMVRFHSIALTGLLPNAVYYYEVESTEDGLTIIDNNGGRYYTFTTQNRPPNEPRLPNPDDGKKNVKPAVVLGWVGGDDDGDNVTYDVYLDIINPPASKISANQSAQFYDPDPDLQSATMYYWRIIAWDDKGASTVGPIWSFTTK